MPRWTVGLINTVLETARLLALAAAAAIWTVNVGILIGVGHV